MILRFVFLILVALAAPAFAAPAPRPLAGKGVVIMAVPDTGTPAIPVYERPGVRRIAELPLQKLPRVAVLPEGQVVPVIEEKSDWLRVVFDADGREGWLRRERTWTARSWQELFRARFARMLPGLRPPLYQVRKTPDERGDVTMTLQTAKRFRIVRLQGNWGQIVVDLTAPGWVRWRDEDGRLLVSVE